ncbi:MAG: hypothetical protein WCV89_00835 [Candidatus Paceibacterota bacterium]
MPQNVPTGIPADTHHPFSTRTLVVFGIILVLVVGSVAWAYPHGYLSFSTSGQTATSTTQGEIATTDPVAWKSIPSETPLVLSVPGKGGYTASYTYYDAGTFTSGPFSGSELVLGIGAPIDALDGSSSSTGCMGRILYLVLNASSTPIGWWNTSNCPASELDLNKLPVLNDSEFPQRLITAGRGAESHYDVPVTPHGRVDYFDGPSFPPTNLEPVTGFQLSGDQVMRAPAQYRAKSIPAAFSGVQAYDYYIQLPTGMVFSLSFGPDFMPILTASSSSRIPLLTWSTGTTTVMRYQYESYYYPSYADCFASLDSFGALKATFIQTGTTNKGDPVYEVNPADHDDVYRCLYAKRQQFGPDYSGYYPMIYSDFISSHPVFFWKSFEDDWMILGQEGLAAPIGGKGKPVIYLYPTKTEQVSVKVDPIGGFTKTDPAYDTGWNVMATPDSVLTNLTDGKTYPYLFWEGGAKGIVNTPKEGFVVAQADIPALLAEKLTLLGLNVKERADFMSFWVPRLSKTPYYFITFVPKSEMDRVAPLTVIPAPDTMIRVLMDYKPLSAPIPAEPLEITTPMRTGFTVVEWGGIIRD